MPPGEFRRWGHRFVDWVADYLEEVGGHPVLARVQPGDVARGLAAEAPMKGEPMEALLGDFQSLVVPGITHWNHPGFLGYFAVSGSGPGILGELLTAALNVNAMVWKSAPAATELEQVTLDWLRGFIGLPSAFTGTINETASISTFHALAAARERGLPEAAAPGLAAAPPGRIYTTPETHSSIAKAVHALGLGREGLHVVATGRGRGMDPAALDEAVRRDVAAGFRPLAVVATIGTTSVTAVDPVDAVADVAAARGIWLHVDAAYAGPAAALARMRSHFRGWERAESIVINPHKWLFTPIDCSALYVRDPAALNAAFSLTPAYLETGEAAVAHNMDLGLALGATLPFPQALVRHALLRPGRAPGNSRTPPGPCPSPRRSRRRGAELGALAAVALLAGRAAPLSRRRGGRAPGRLEHGDHGPRERFRHGLHLTHGEWTGRYGCAWPSGISTPWRSMFAPPGPSSRKRQPDLTRSPSQT